MKKTVVLLLLLVAAMSLRAFDYLPVQFPSGEWAMIDLKGNMHFRNRFESIHTNVYEDVFAATEPGKTLSVYRITSSGFVCIASDIKNAGYCNGGLIPIVRPGKPVEVINKQGKTVFILDSVNGERVDHCEASFHFGFLHFETAKRTQGLVNAHGRVILFGFRDVGALNYRTVLAQRGKELLIYDYEGRLVRSVPYSYSGLFSLNADLCMDFRLPQARLLVKDSEGKLKNKILIDSKGDVVNDTLTLYKYKEGPKEALILCENSKGYGVLNYYLDTIVPLKYQFIHIAEQGIFARRSKDAPYEMITYKGKNLGTEWCRMTGFIGQNDIETPNPFLVLSDGRDQQKSPVMVYIFNDKMQVIYHGELKSYGKDFSKFYCLVTSDAPKSKKRKR